MGMKPKASAATLKQNCRKLDMAVVTGLKLGNLEADSREEIESLKHQVRGYSDDLGEQVNLVEILSSSREDAEARLARERSKAATLENKVRDLEHQLEVMRLKNEKLRFAMQDHTEHLSKMPSVARLKAARECIEDLLKIEREYR